jgi:hypothetical protein
MHRQDARAAVRLMRESQNTQPPGLRFRAVMTEGGTQMNFYCEGFDRLGEVSV